MIETRRFKVGDVFKYARTILSTDIQSVKEILQESINTASEGCPASLEFLVPVGAYTHVQAGVRKTQTRNMTTHTSLEHVVLDKDGPVPRDKRGREDIGALFELRAE